VAQAELSNETGKRGRAPSALLLEFTAGGIPLIDAIPMEWLLLLVRYALAGVFTLSALAKVGDLPGSRRALEDFGVAEGLAKPLAPLLPIVELGTAGLLLPAATARWGAFAALFLLLVFSVAIAINLAHGKKPDCHCFGQIHTAPIGWQTLARNGLLAALAGLVLSAGDHQPSPGSLLGIASAGTVTWVALGVATAALALAAFEAWLIFNLLAQQGRLIARLERVERPLDLGPGTGLPLGEEAPNFKAADLAGHIVTLAELRSAGRPVLLFFMNPTCTPCDEVMPDVARWQRELGNRVTIAAITDGSVESNRAKAGEHGLSNVLLQKEREIKEAFDITATPAAILIGADGRMQSRNAYLASGVQGLIDQALTGVPYNPVRVAPESGNGHHPAPGPSISDPAPGFSLPNLNGDAMDLAELRGSPALLLFWRPSCSFCQQMLPALKQWEQRRPAESPRLLLVSSGTVEENRSMQLESPVLLDNERSVMQAYGATGTPNAVLVDSEGRIASSVVVGAQAVMALARSRYNAAGQPVKAQNGWW
jgi:peroxiredoxin